MFRFPSSFAFAVIFKQLREILQRLFFSLVNLIRVDAVFGSDLCHAFFFSDGFQYDLCLLAGG